jgi:hypothetical protein
MKEKLHKYGIKIFGMCKSKSGYVCTLEEMTQTLSIQVSAPSILLTDSVHW